MNKPRSEDWLDEPTIAPTMQVHETEAHDTGLLDRYGRKLVRPKGKLGF